MHILNVCIYAHIYLYISIYVWKYMNIYVFVCTYIYRHTLQYCTYICTVCVCLSVYVYVCTVYIYTLTESQSTVCVKTRTGLKIVSFACRARCSLILETRQLLKVRRSGCRRRKLSVWKSFQPVTQPITDIFLEIEVSLIQSAVLLRLVMRCQKTKDEDRLLQILYYFYTHGCFPGYIKTAKYGLLVLSCLFFQLLDVFEKSSHM